MAHFAVLIAAGFILAGCASSSPRLYTVEARPGTVRSGAPTVITVRSFGVPRYLERSEIVRADGPERLAASDNDWWAEPLRVMLRRVIVEDISQRLPSATVLEGAGAISAHSDVEVEFELQRFEMDDANQVTMVGYVAVERGASRTIERLRMQVPTAGSTMGDQVSAMSIALGRAADVAVTELAR